MSVRKIGAQVSLLFQTKFPTFTADQFNKAFNELGYTAIQGNANISNNPGAKPVPTVIFSKGNLSVVYNQNQYLIIFQFLNTVDLDKLYDAEIKPMLIKLNFVEEAINMIGLECNIQISTKTPPQEILSSLIKKEFIDKVNEILGDSKLNTTSLRLSTSFPFGNDGIQVIIEPLGNDPKGSYFVNLVYRTPEMNKFNEFVKIFGTRMLEKLAGATEHV